MQLNEKLDSNTIILASNSPRRKQFLTDLGVSFTVKPTDVDESYPSHLKGYEIALHIANAKLNAFEELTESDIVITCDTIVWANDTALGKPENYNEAYEMLSLLSGKTHEVISAVALKSKNKSLSFYDTTKVSFNELSHDVKDYYIRNYQPFDKAGAYGIQEWIGLIGISKIEGSYTNVVGMPMEKLYNTLINW